MPDDSVPVIVGNPFSPTGRGTTALNHFRALRETNARVKLCDVMSRMDSGQTKSEVDVEAAGFFVSKPGPFINIYHLNANEVDSALVQLKNPLPDGAYNILYPFWELSTIPEVWLSALALFDEIWSPSLFIRDALRKAVSQPVTHLPLPAETRFSSFLGRSYFGLPESSYLFLFFFDFRSFIDRKNPRALLQVFQRVLAARPNEDFRVVVKLHGSEISTDAARHYREFAEQIRLSGLQDRIILIDTVYSDNEMKNLIRCCDCFISLHRSEGFGLGLAEAMYLGKPVIGTAYSGNMDFMRGDISCLVDYKLIPVQDGQYPFAEGQVWADPDLDQASAHVVKLLDDRDFGRELGRRASQHMRTHFSYLALGLRYQGRLEEVSQFLLASPQRSELANDAKRPQAAIPGSSK